MAAWLSWLSGTVVAGQPPRTDYESVLLAWKADAAGEDSLDQESFFQVLASLGFDVERIASGELDATQLRNRSLLVLPHPSATILSPAASKKIRDAVRAGLNIITDGESHLSRAFGIDVGDSVVVSEIHDFLRPELTLHWPTTTSVPYVMNVLSKGTVPAYIEVRSHRPLAIIIHGGKGKCLFFAPLFDPVTGGGYGRFVTLPGVIVNAMGLEPPASRRGADAYFDPGFRYAIPIEQLAALWRQWGIRAVHAASWYYFDDPPYDYARLIKAAHENGILVYAWLEWPYVGKGFWNEHPEWRQKNALLEDAQLGFLYLMDLQDPACMQAALHRLEQLLEESWDGIDIAEFTITGAGGEALAGPARPDFFVSFGSHARTEFRERAGFDPVQLFDTTSRHYWRRDSSSLRDFYLYRRDVNNRLLRELLQRMWTLNRQGRGWELIHTIVDNSLHPEFDNLLGFDLLSTLQVVKQFNVTLNVEDPYMEWTKPPERYTVLGGRLGQLVGDSACMIDINVVPIHPPDQKGFTTAQATGTELLEQYHAASAQGRRVCFYAESSVFRDDWELLPFAMAGGTMVRRNGNAWVVTAPYTVELKNIRPKKRVELNGKDWPCYDDRTIVIPAGTHLLSFAEKKSEKAHAIRLLSVGGEVLHAASGKRWLDIEYSAPYRCALTLSAKPGSMLVDDAAIDLPVLHNAGRFVVLAPPGHHRIRLIWNPS